MMAGVLASPAPPASARSTPIGGLGEVLHIDFMGVVADIAVTGVRPSEMPPGWGYGPRGPAYLIERGDVTVHIIKAPNPYITSLFFNFRGVNTIGDAYEPRNTDAPDDLMHALQNAPPGATVSGGVWWDAYRNPVTNVVLIDKVSGEHLAQWNL
jgi:hypothetical protein